MRRINVSLVFVCTLAMAFADIGFSQTASPAVVPTQVKFLVSATDVLVGRYGIPISFEDVSAYEYLGELTEWHPAPAIAALNPNRRKTLITDYTLDLNPPDLGPAPAVGDVAKVLGEILNQHHRKGNPGQFQIIGTAESLVVAPTARRNSAGSLVPDRSPLETRISFPETDRTADGAVEALCDALRASSALPGRTLVCGSSLKRLRVQVGADNEPARDVLVKIAANLRLDYVPAGRAAIPPPRIVWKFGPDPGSEITMLTVHPVEMERQGSYGKITQTAVFRTGPLLEGPAFLIPPPTGVVPAK